MTLADYRALVGPAACRWCGAKLPEEVRYYEHPDGWRVEGFSALLWLFLRCVNCDYDWSLWKLGVPRRLKA